MHCNLLKLTEHVNAVTVQLGSTSSRSPGRLPQEVGGIYQDIQNIPSGATIRTEGRE